MKRNSSKLRSYAVVICSTTLLFCFSVRAAIQENGTALMLDASPAEGGYLNISTGVHMYDIDSDVMLKAVPKSGYQFVCWLGNVSNATASSTTVLLNSPKMVIAVFERTQFAMVGTEEQEVTGGGEGNGGLVPSGGLSDTSLEEAEPKYSSSSSSSLESHEKNPPVPTPEPATITLCIAGFLMLANRRKNGGSRLRRM